MKKIYHNPYIAIFICFFILALGLKNFFDLPIALYPNTSQTVLGVNLNFNNISPEDFRDRYGKKIETALSSLDGAGSIEGNYRNDSVTWKAHFTWDTEAKKAKLDVKSALGSIEQSFPESWGHFRIYPYSSQNSNIYIALSSDHYSDIELHRLFEKRALSHLRSIEGLEEAQIWLPMSEYVRIELKPSLLEARGLTFLSIKKALNKKRYDHNLGELKLGDSQYDIIVPLKNRSLEGLKKTIVFSEKGENFYLEDFADISLETRNDDMLMKANGKKALIAFGSVKTSGNISYVAKEYISRLEKTVSEFNGSVNMSVVLDPSKFIEEAVSNVFLAILIGILIATLIIFLFLGSFGHTFVVALSIPLSVVGGFTLMDLLGIEINLISLGALALSVGMVVDGAIVVLENISRHFDDKKPKTKEEKIQIILESVSEVRPSVIASLLTTIIVFAPLAFTAPLANAILGDLARVMVCVLVISVLVTLYLIPPLLVFFSSSPKADKTNFLYLISNKFSSFISLVGLAYTKTLRFFMRNKKVANLTFFILFILLSCSLYVLKNHVKREILAKPDTDKIWLHVSLQAENLELDEVEKFVRENIEEVVKKDFSQYFKHYFIEIGKRWGAQILFTLKDKSLQDEFKKVIEERFINTARVRYHLYPWNPTALKIDKEPLFDLIVAASSDKESRKTLKELTEIFSASDNIGRTDFDPYPRKRTFFKFNLDEEKIKRIEKETGVALFEDIASSLEPYISDVLVYPMTIGKKEYDLRLSYPENKEKNIEDFKNIIFKIKDKYYPLRSFAYFSEKEENAQFFTKDGQEIFQAKIWTKSSFKGDREALKQEIINKMKSEGKFDFHDLSFRETGKEINESLRSLLDSFFFALFLILLVLVLQFGNFKQTFIIMLAIPLGLIGVSFSLFAFSSTLSLNSMLGLILLSGTAVNNSILLTDFFNRLNRSYSLRDLERSILEASSLRLRPILITTLTTILGMFPIACAFDTGGKVLQPLGIAVCGGLGVSTFFTLFVIPLVLFRVEGRKWS